jgi:nicotinate phosphoribosyltransferase
MNKFNKAMVIDFYELTMANGYFLEGKAEEVVYFDLFYRSNPDQGGFALFAGLERVVKYIENLHFTDEDISFLESKNVLSKGFLDYLKSFSFSGDIIAFPEGSIIFPNEPIITIKSNIIEAQLIETFILQTVNHQTLIATKAARIRYAAKDKIVIEMGARRAHGIDSSVEGSRAAYIAGINATSNVAAEQLYGVSSGGTMAHSWVQSYDSEYSAFKAYATHYPKNTILLVDTFNTLNSGVPNAIKVIKEVLFDNSEASYGIRIDSGDLAYLSKQARMMLDNAGLDKCKIIVSNALDEFSIKTLLDQGAPIDIFGVGERLITAKSDPVFGAVYKIIAKSINGEITPIIKISDNPIKITTPHFKKVYRVLNHNNRPVADYITVHDEVVDQSKPLVLFDPNHPWKRKEISNYTLKDIRKVIFKDGKLVYKLPNLEDIRLHAKTNLDGLWIEMRRFSHPHKYYVDLSQKLWDIKDGLMNFKLT